MENPQKEYMHIKDVIFNKDFITINTTNNKGENNNMYDLKGDGRRIYTAPQLEIEVEVMDNKVPKTIGIIKKQNEISLRYEKKIEKLKSEDKIALLQNEYAEKVKDFLPQNSNVYVYLYSGEYYTEETQKQISLLQNAESAETTKLLLLYREIVAQLVACETYEQEINILNIYGVLKDGKVNA
jgi:hypothetical protein